MDREELLGVAQFEREALGRTIQYTPHDRWEADSACAGWRNRDVIAHLAASEAAAAESLAGEDPAEVQEFRAAHDDVDPTLDEFNEFSVAKRRETPFRQVVLEWGQAADLFLVRAAKVSDEDWTGRRVWWFAGEIPIRYLVQSRVAEWWIHGEDVRAGAGLPVRLEHWPIYTVIDLSVRMIPYALSLAGLSHPNRSVQIGLQGAGEGTWHYGLAPRYVPPEGKRPDAYIEGRSYAFALVAARRVPAELYLDDGTLVIGGDEAVALDVLDTIRAFP